MFPAFAWRAEIINSPGGFFDADGDPIGSKFAPKFIGSKLPEALESMTYVEGHRPRDAAQVSIDEGAADEAGLELGETIRLAAVERAKSFRLVGIVKLGDASFGGASIAAVTLPEAQRLTGKRGQFDEISVAAHDGVSEAELKRRIERESPPARVETAKENVERDSDQIRDDLGFLQHRLLVFAFVALFVGAFLIFNTFSITVAQRVSRVRHAAHARRLARPDPRLGRGRGAGDRVIGAMLGLLGGYVMAVAAQRLLKSHSESTCRPRRW